MLRRSVLPFILLLGDGVIADGDGKYTTEVSRAMELVRTGIEDVISAMVGADTVVCCMTLFDAEAMVGKGSVSKVGEGGKEKDGDLFPWSLYLNVSLTMPVAAGVMLMLMLEQNALKRMRKTKQDVVARMGMERGTQSNVEIKDCWAK